MKKIITLLTALTLSGMVTTPLLACGDPAMDTALDIIKKGEGHYELWSLGITGIKKPAAPKCVQKPKLEQKLAPDNIKQLGKNIANKILNTAKSNRILWFSEISESVSDNTKCYDFSINNGEINPTTGEITWPIDATTGRIKVEINYQVGIIKNKKFEQQAQITKTFNLKCDYTVSDYKVYKLANDINAIAISGKKIEVELTNATKVHENDTYNSFSLETKRIIQEAIDSVLKDNHDRNAVTIRVKEIGEKVIKEHNKLTYKITFILKFQDSMIDMSLKPSYDDKIINYNNTILNFYD